MPRAAFSFQQLKKNERMTRVMERIKSQTGWDKLRNEIRTTEIIRGASPVES